MPERIRPPRAEKVPPTPEAIEQKPALIDEEIASRPLEAIREEFDALRTRVTEYTAAHGHAISLPDIAKNPSTRLREWDERHGLALLSEVMRRFLDERYEDLTPDKIMGYIFHKDRTDTISNSWSHWQYLTPREYDVLVSIKFAYPQAAAIPKDAAEMLKKPRTRYNFYGRAIPTRDLIMILNKALAHDGDKIAIIKEKLYAFERNAVRGAPVAGSHAAPTADTLKFLRANCTPETLTKLGI